MTNSSYVEETISDISDLLKKLKKFIKPNQPTWFRGQSNQKWKLVPTLAREKNGVDAELTMIKRFKQNALPFSVVRPSTEAEWLFLMQHHGLPTRLLDWTESPLVALYFAVNQTVKIDGALWCLFPTKLNYNASIKYNYDMEIPCFDHDETLVSYLPSKLASERTSSLSPLAAIAVRNNPRIYAQLGTFTITHRSQIPIENIGDQKHIIKLIVHSKNKMKIKEQLSFFSINELTLFPELDNVALIARKDIK